MLALMLVAKSFIVSHDIVHAMMLETTLHIQSDGDICRLEQSAGCGPKPLCLLHVLEFAAPFTIESRMTLQKVKSLLPNLTQIRIDVQSSSPSL